MLWRRIKKKYVEQSAFGHAHLFPGYASLNVGGADAVHCTCRGQEGRGHVFSTYALHASIYLLRLLRRRNKHADMAGLAKREPHFFFRRSPPGETRRLSGRRRPSKRRTNWSFSARFTSGKKKKFLSSHYCRRRKCAAVGASVSIPSR